MHIFLLFSIILVAVSCAPVNDESQAKILSYQYHNYENGNYVFSYSTSNGISREEQGTIVNKGEPDEHIEVRGSYYYLRPDGIMERIEYTADKNGFKYSTEGPLDLRVDASPALVASLLGK